MSYYKLVLARRKYLKQSVWKTRLVLWFSAVVIGVVATLLALAGDQADLFFKQAFAQFYYLPLALTPLGFALITWLTQKYFFAAQGSGIPQTIAALKMPKHKQRIQVLSFSIAFGKVLLILLGLLCGASIGRGGPTIHIGAALAYAFTRFARFPFHHLSRGLILAGAAAGLTAAFNTPLAGIMFTIEEMTRHYEEKINATIIIVVIIASITFMSILGNFRYFAHVDSHLAHYGLISMIGLCGLTGGVIGGLFTFLLTRSSAWLAPVRRAYPYYFAFLCGLLVALIGMYSLGHAFGTGYFEVLHILQDPHQSDAYYPLAKMLATAISYLSGIPGGIFTPTLSIGAGIGSHLSQWFNLLPANTLVLLCMAAYFSGVMQTPITAAILLAEMTGNIDLILPLLACSVIAAGVSRVFNPTPIYRALAAEFLKEMKTLDHKAIAARP